VIFTTTPDLNAAYPAKAARQLGWTRVALMGGQEADVSGGLPMCVRVLVHWNTEKSLDEIEHVFLRGAAALPPDLSQSSKLILNVVN
jgi:chorismate mutase